jgi:hypothetical protein
MITKEQALALRYREVIHYGTCKTLVGKKGGLTYKTENWRVDGKAKTWKTRPNEFKIPIKFGLYQHSYLTEHNMMDFHLEENCIREEVKA